MEFPKNLHHAYILEGDIDTSKEALFNFLDISFGIRHGNADLFQFSSESLSIDDARAMTDANTRKSISSSGKKFIVADFSSISGQAQNSLLKTLEEPYPGTHIFLITRTAAAFLPTVLSRVHVLTNRSASHMKGGDSFNPKEAAKKFVAAKPPERLEMIKDLMSKKEDEKIRDGDIEQFVGEAETLAHSKLKDKKQLATFTVVDEYLGDQSSSTKMLLEYLALTLPTVGE